METILQTLIPVATLILGYLLNVWMGSVESKRDVERRRIEEKEKAYGLIIGKLHDIFETYRIYTLQTTSTIAESPIWGTPDESVMPKKFQELETLVFEHSLYLKPSVIQSLADLKLTVFRTRLERLDQQQDETARISFLEKHADDMWKKAKAIICEMRHEIGFEEYPDDMLAIWR